MKAYLYGKKNVILQIENINGLPYEIIIGSFSKSKRIYEPHFYRK